MNTPQDSAYPPEFTIAAIHEALAAHQPRTAPSKESPRRAAVAMILNNGGCGVECLFMKRAEHPEDPWSGHMSLPGGRQDPADLSLEAAARRETLEEVGLTLEPAMRLGRLHDIYGGRLSRFELTVSPYVYHCPEPGPIVHNEEVADTVWIPLAFLGDVQNIQNYVFPLDPQHRNFPSFQFGTYTIWGLTYRIIADFMNLFGIRLPTEKPLTNVE